MNQMRRDYFTLDVRNLDTDGPPTVEIAFDGPADQLTDRLTAGGETLEADELDVAFRLQDPPEATDATGVVGVTNRVTGEFILELNAEAGDVFAFIDAAREFGKNREDDVRYRIVVGVDGDTVLNHGKEVFLVYDPDGELLRGHSLIPSGVEL